MHTVSLHASNPHLRGNFAQGHRSRSRSLQKSRKTVYRLKILFINRFMKNKMLTVSLHASNPHLRGNFAQGHRSRSRSHQKSRKPVHPLKFLFINRFTKNKMLTVSLPLHASNPHLRGNFAQVYRSRLRSHQKSRKPVYPLKCLFIYRFTKSLFFVNRLITRRTCLIISYRNKDP